MEMNRFLDSSDPNLKAVHKLAIIDLSTTLLHPNIYTVLLANMEYYMQYNLDVSR